MCSNKSLHLFIFYSTSSFQSFYNIIQSSDKSHYVHALQITITITLSDLVSKVCSWRWTDLFTASGGFKRVVVNPKKHETIFNLSHFKVHGGYSLDGFEVADTDGSHLNHRSLHHRRRMIGFFFSRQRVESVRNYVFTTSS